MRKRHPNAEIILAADNDKWTDGNPGVTKAKEAALTIDGKLAIPEFKDLNTKPTDFNDLQRQEGLPAVSGQLNAGAPVQAEESDQEAIARLAKMSAAEYESKRKEAAKKLGWRVGFLDEEVRRLKAEWRADAIKQSGSKEEVKPAIECPALDHEDPISLLDGAIGGLGYGGEKNLPKLLYLCYTSRLLAFDRGNLLSHAQVVGSPSSGKNYLVDTALALLPDTAYLKIYLTRSEIELF